MAQHHNSKRSMIGCDYLFNSFYPEIFYFPILALSEWLLQVARVSGNVSLTKGYITWSGP